MEAELVDWLIIGGFIALVLSVVITDKVSRSLDDGWLNDFVKKRRQKKIESTMPEKPPFSLDKPNSCQYCEHNLYTGRTCNCDAYFGMNKYVETWWWSKERSGFRTWDRCDYYMPLKNCCTCRYGPAEGRITETRIIGDEEIEVTIPSTKCPYISECKYADKWEPRRVSE